jgi:hypothetical protein
MSEATEDHIHAYYRSIGYEWVDKYIICNTMMLRIRDQTFLDEHLDLFNFTQMCTSYSETASYHETRDIGGDIFDQETIDREHMRCTIHDDNRVMEFYDLSEFAYYLVDQTGHDVAQPKPPKTKPTTTSAQW